jgi:hypothetical protein
VHDLIISLFDPTKQSASPYFITSMRELLGGNQNFLVYSLTLASSQRVRTEAKEII